MSNKLTPLILLLLLYFAAHFFWAGCIPISQAPDEGAHWWVVQWLYRAHAFPALADMAADPRAAYYGALPPLPYILSALAGSAMPWLELAWAARIFNVILGSLVVILAYLMACRLSGSRLLRFAIPAFVVLHPQFAFVSSYINNDVCASVLCSLVLYLCCRWRASSFALRPTVALGLACGALALSKSTAYIGIPLVIWTALFEKVPAGMNWRKRLAKLAAVGAIAAVVSLPWFVANYIRFNGDVTGVRTMLTLWHQGFGVSAPLFSFPVINHFHWWYWLFISFWGTFGNMDRPLPNRQYFVFIGFILASLAGWAISRWTAKGSEPADAQNAEAIQVAADWRAQAILFGLGMVALVVTSTFMNPEGPPLGRYLFGAEIPIASLLVGGLYRLPKRAGTAAVWGLLIYLAYSFGWSLVHMHQWYGFSYTIFR